MTTLLPPLLGPGDPPAVTVLNPTGAAPLLLLCDHASATIPARLACLGVADCERQRHIAYDIGAAAVAAELAEAFDAPLVLSGYSRLVIDCNRRPNDATAIPPVSDGTPIPGNQGLDAASRQARIDAIFIPYHRTITDLLDGFQARGVQPAILSIHSCTPVMAGFQRPWEVGVLWNRDDRIAGPLIAALQRDEICTGDNQPYSGRDGHGYTLPTHAEATGLPHVLLEIRQDLITEAAGQRAWARRLHGLLAPILEQLAL